MQGGGDGGRECDGPIMSVGRLCCECGWREALHTTPDLCHYSMFGDGDVCRGGGGVGIKHWGLL